MAKQEKICKNCGKELTGRQRNFCSQWCKCHFTNYKEESKVCPNCHKEFVWRHYVKFCSIECAKAFHNNKTIWARCLNCGKELVGRKGKKFCDRDCKAYYNHHKSETKKCEVCWTLFNWTCKTKYCSDECRLKWKIYNEVQTNLKKYWVEFSQQNKEVREKWKQTCLSKYWTEYVRQTEVVKDKVKQICLQKYGVPYYCMTKQCREAAQAVSNVNLAFVSLLKEQWIDGEIEFPLWHYSYDIKVWNVLIEINPYPYHNSTRNPLWDAKRPDYHYNKLKLARDNWYRCIMVRDWDDLTKIPYLLEENKQQLYARKCEVKEISREECHDFFESYHLQWNTRIEKNNIYIWLYYENNLVECMSFWKPRYNKNYEREILRLCSHKDYKIIWWANKIFKHFLELTQANSVISYCDMSKFDWWVYEQLGFKLFKWNKPSKHWYNNKEVPSRQHITDNLLRQRWYDQIFWENYGKWANNDELMRQRGYVEIYDCGQSTFVWTR